MFALQQALYLLAFAGLHRCVLSVSQIPLLRNPFLSVPNNYGGEPTHSQSMPFADFVAPEQSLANLSADEFTTLSHPAFPGVAARVKRAKDFCDLTVKAYTGYIDVDYEAKHLFFYFFESRSEPEKDDVVLFLNGGPGGSSAMALFMELGPCSIDTTKKGGNGTVFNPYSWNNEANLFFLDQPVGVGFSYADYGEVVETTEDAAKNFAAFMYIFFDTFGFKGRPFHLSGESYGGRYIPVFASEIVDQNKRAAVGGFTPINMKSVMIGNGMTDWKAMNSGYYEMTCTNASIPPVLDISTCVRMKRALPRCEKMIQDGCADIYDDLACTAAVMFCENELVVPLVQSGKNPYDISKDCDGTFNETLCYPIRNKIEEYLNRPDTRFLLGTDPTPAHYSLFSPLVNWAFITRRMDMWTPGTSFYIAGLLERGVDVLIYVGSYDLLCNWIGNSRWVAALEWHGQAEYNSKEFDEWTVDGHVAGITKSAKGLTFATVQGAGHMVPHDKPVESLAMVHRWLSSRSLHET